MLHQKSKIVNGWRSSQSEIRNSAVAKARAGKNSFPPTPFLFARPARADWFLAREARHQFRSK